MRLKTIVAAVLGMAGVAVAGPVTMNFQGTGTYGGNVTVNINNAALASQAGFSRAQLFAGQLSYRLNGSLVTTFCTELTQLTAAQGTNQSYMTAPLAAAPTPGAGMGNAKASAIDSLFRGAFASLSNSAEARAFQVLIWEIVYDFDGTLASLNLNSGNLSFSGVNSNRFNALKNLIGTATSGTPAVYAVTSATYQDQIVYDPRGAVSVPLPPATLAAIPAVAIVGVRALRRR